MKPTRLLALAVFVLLLAPTLASAASRIKFKIGMDTDVDSSGAVTANLSLTGIKAAYLEAVDAWRFTLTCPKGVATSVGLCEDVSPYSEYINALYLSSGETEIGELVFLNEGKKKATAKIKIEALDARGKVIGSASESIKLKRGDKRAIEAARRSAEVARTKSRLASARAYAELYYDDSLHGYSGFCKSDSYRTVMEGVPSVACHSSRGEWAAEALLNGGYFCADWTGYLGDSRGRVMNEGETTCARAQ